jgi:hypothetical protein
MIAWMNSRTRSRRPASIGSNQSSKSGRACRLPTAGRSTSCYRRSWRGLHRRRTRGLFGFQHPETTPAPIPTTPRTAPASRAAPRGPRWWDAHSESLRKMAQKKVSHLIASRLIVRENASSLGDAICDCKAKSAPSRDALSRHPIYPRLDYIPALIVNIAKAVMEDRQTAAAETSRRFQFQGSSSCSWETMMAMRRSTPASHA